MMLFSGFDGLVEIAVFAIGSVLFSVLTIFLLWTPQQSNACTFSWTETVAESVTVGIARFRKPVLFAALCLCVFGAVKLRFDDDIRQLQPVSPSLLADEKWVQEKSGFGISSGMIFVSAKTKVELAARIDRVGEGLRSSTGNALYTGAQGRNSFLPSKKEQLESLRQYQTFLVKHGEALRLGLSELGMTESVVNKIFELGKPFEAEISEYDLGVRDGRHWSFLQVFGVREHSKMKRFVAEQF